MISVIVPVYKVESYLRQCIDSILNQTYKDLEILLIDDGSPDKCGEICDEYAKEDTRIRVFHTKNQGLSAARNIGLREAMGEYIGFVDSDDWLDPGMYEILLQRLEETGTSISTCGILMEYKNNKKDSLIDDDIIYTGNDAVRALICKETNYVWNKLYKKAVWKDDFFPEKHLFEDISTIYKVVLKAGPLSCVKKALYHYRMREGSIVHTQSMSILMDFWNALYNRNTFLITSFEFKEDHEFKDYLEKQIAFTSAKIWILTFNVPREQRDPVSLHMLSDYIQKNFPSFQKKKWGLTLSIFFFFFRHKNVFLLTILLKLKSIRTFFRHINRVPFPR